MIKVYLLSRILQQNKQYLYDKLFSTHIDTYIEVYFSILKKKLILGSSNFKNK